MKAKKYTLFIFIALLATMCGCNSSRQSALRPVYDNRAVSLDERFDMLTGQYGSWKDINMSMKLSLTSPQKISVSGKAVMVRDKSVSLSFRFLGMEVMSIFLTGDSVFATDKMHKYYLAESLESVMNDYPVTITDVQNLLLGQAFVIGEGTMTRQMGKQVNLAEISDAYWAIEPKKKYGDISYAFAADSLNRLASLAINRDTACIVSCDYSRHTATRYGLFACDNTVTATLGNQNISATLKWDIDQAKWDSGSDKQWKQPKGYKRITARQLLKALSNR